MKYKSLNVFGAGREKVAQAEKKLTGISVSSLVHRFYSKQKVQIKSDDGIANASTTVSARIRHAEKGAGGATAMGPGDTRGALG